MIYNPIKSLKVLLCQDRDYIRDNKKFIAKNNEKMLQICCIIYLIVLMVYSVTEFFISTSRILTLLYFVFDVFHICFTIAEVLYSKMKHKSYYSTQCMCIVFEISFLAFFAIEGATVNVNVPALYVPIAIMLAVVTFTHDAKHTCSVIAVYCVGFEICSFIMKPYSVAILDLQIAIATMLAAYVGYFLIVKLRLSERSAIRRLEYLSTVDQLTGVYNKQAMESLCESYIESKRDNAFGSYALVMIDIDNFKHINDTYGHDEGDKILNKFGSVLKNSFFDKDFIGRFGGDEFIVMMNSNAGQVKSIERKMNMVLNKVSNITLGEGKENLSCSIGVAMVDEISARSETYKEIFARADAMLYKSKNAGKGKYFISESHETDDLAATV